jgi:hypothetical protein
VSGQVEGPIIWAEKFDGSRIPGFLISSPSTFPLSDYVLLVCFESIPRLSQHDETALTFIGGFDSKSTVNNHKTGTQFLALSYPTSDYSTLKNRIGTIDL